MEKMVLVVATRNQGKSSEIRSYLNHPALEIRDLNDFGPIPEIVEDGNSFDDNAYKKASFTAKILGFPALADDSGLEVEALEGAPGVYSARYAGENAGDAENNAKLLREMAGVTDRRAHFRCVLSLAVPMGFALTYEAHCDGDILSEPRGSHGFGYDPLFFYPPMRKTFAELTMEEKLQVSHRGRALMDLQKELDRVISWLTKRLAEEKRLRLGDICMHQHG
ncbi:MAG TPA: Non-canonical purine NTP pyrophosphatase [Syntrophobacteraceae bacterium]|nr:Non-canonical purine NTP pyrophosphatase [Syntrophobacteraceae bacterium]